MSQIEAKSITKFRASADLRRAIRLRAALYDVEMGQVMEEALRAYLPTELETVRKNDLDLRKADGANPKPGQKRKGERSACKPTA